MDLVDKQAGADNVVYVLTSDHGVSPVPEVNQARENARRRASRSLALVEGHPSRRLKRSTGRESGSWQRRPDPLPQP